MPILWMLIHRYISMSLLPLWIQIHTFLSVSLPTSRIQVHTFLSISLPTLLQVCVPIFFLYRSTHLDVRIYQFQIYLTRSTYLYRDPIFIDLRFYAFSCVSKRICIRIHVTDRRIQMYISISFKFTLLDLCIYKDTHFFIDLRFYTPTRVFKRIRVRIHLNVYVYVFTRQKSTYLHMYLNLFHRSTFPHIRICICLRGGFDQQAP